MFVIQLWGVDIDMNTRYNTNMLTVIIIRENLSIWMEQNVSVDSGDVFKLSIIGTRAFVSLEWLLLLMLRWRDLPWFYLFTWEDNENNASEVLYFTLDL